ncbi:PPOX class probable F420-dependent enzyme [Nocardia otitidiscaviarum]|uniref:PPOX class probable F420-dependent enzyme n=1 Tax=Nocardia otitidiscaviarum TaxID=1823 RepID=A0A378YUR4_9NOCA|nr:pyridoxamine 5'-phosphate oxidase family protein [Nocardia otitidiscaviarum]SUA80915.1 PPOX class probable F420-dependent enzyme [Nocardia otitidiscaviarum]
MTPWTEFAAAAPRIATIFRRRHTATGNLCMLATLRSDGAPRISPMEPLFFEDRLWLIGMPNTTKFHDLQRDPRFCLHTATVDTMVGDGDAKLWGTVENIQDEALHARFAEHLYQDSGMDLRGEKFDPFFGVEITGASAVELIDGQLEIAVWKPGGQEYTIRKE